MLEKKSVSKSKISMLKHMRQFQEFCRDIKIAHTLFAMPFAVAAAWLSENTIGYALAFKVLLCMISARSFAMGMNRWLDRKIDVQNPRTRQRGIPSGRLSSLHGFLISLIFGGIFLTTSFSINNTVGVLSFPILGLFIAYSIGKRVTPFVHWILGVCLGCAPVGVGLVLDGAISLPHLLLGVALCFWSAGFDIIYSLEDMGFDKSLSLKSMPSVYGAVLSYKIAALNIGLMLSTLSLLGILLQRGRIYWFGMTILVVLTLFFLKESWVRVRASSFSGLGLFSLNFNLHIGCLFLLFLQLDFLLGLV